LHGGNVLTLHAALHSWTLDPLAVVGIVLGAGWYARSVRRLHRGGGGHWSPWRSVLFTTGLLLIGYTTLGWFGAYAHTFLWAYTVQIMVLLVIAPALLMFGRPISLAREASEPGRSALLVRIAESRPVVALSHPALGPLLLPLVTMAFFFTAVLPVSLAYYGVYELLHAVLLAAGLLLAIGLAGEGGPATSMTMAAAMLCAFLELLADAIPGIAIRLRSTPLAPQHYLAVHRGGGPSPVNDMHLAGSIVWFLAETIDLPVLAILIVRWIRADEREAQLVDRQLDLERPLTTSVDGAAEGPLDKPRDTPLDKPWWETDARVFGDRRAAAFQRPAPARDD
jgi:putative copper resistance protein D